MAWFQYKPSIRLCPDGLLLFNPTFWPVEVNNRATKIHLKCSRQIESDHTEFKPIVQQLMVGGPKADHDSPLVGRHRPFFLPTLHGQSEANRNHWIPLEAMLRESSLLLAVKLTSINPSRVIDIPPAKDG